MLILARHGTTALNEQGVIQGAQDFGLSEAGRDEAGRLARWIAGNFDIQLIFASPARRALETAHFVLSSLSREAPVTIVEELREREYGSFEGLDTDQLKAARRQRGLALDDLRQNWANSTEVESDAEVWRRFRHFADTAGLMSLASRLDVLAVSHGGVIKAILCSALGIPPERPFPFMVNPASATVLAVRGEYLQLSALRQNEYSH
jgi:broad specificity phosphatase PhoE